METHRVDGKNPQRSLRRHHRFRMRRRAARLNFGVLNLPQNASWIQRLACRRGDTYSVCSGLCCGNPRRRWGDVTRQESIAQIRFEEEMLTLQSQARPCLKLPTTRDVVNASLDLPGKWSVARDDLHPDSGADAAAQ